MAEPNSWEGARGMDSFGPFRMRTSERAQACSRCGERGVVLRYSHTKFKLPEGVEVERTILSSPKTYIGVTCGCYAKFHRQVAHIFDSMQLKRKNGDQLPAERHRD